MRAMLALLAVVLLLPSAVACSLGGPVAGPGTFTLWPHDGGDPIEIPVHGRSLGGMCELSNRHVLVDGVFAWIEHPERSRGSTTVHMRDLAGGEEHVVVLDHSDVQAFAVWEGRIATYAVTYDDLASPEGAHHFLLHDATGGSAEEIPFPEGRWTSVAFGGRHVAASMRTNGYDGPDLFYLYDLAAERFVIEAKPAHQIVGDDILWTAAVDDTWVLAGGRDGGRVLYEIATGLVLDAPRALANGGPGSVTLADGYAYSWSWGDGAQRTLLPDGPVEMISPVKGTVVGVVPGYTIVGEYSPTMSAPTPAREVQGDWFGSVFGLIGWLLSAFLGALFR